MAFPEPPPAPKTPSPPYVPGDLAERGDLTLADLHDAHDDDEGERQELAGGEDVLHPGGPPHAGAVHPCQQH